MGWQEVAFCYLTLFG